MFDWLVNGFKGLGDGLASGFKGLGDGLAGMFSSGSAVKTEDLSNTAGGLAANAGNLGNAVAGVPVIPTEEVAKNVAAAGATAGAAGATTANPGLAASAVQSNFLKDTAIPAMGIYGAYKSGKAAENEYKRKLANISANTQVASKVWGGSNNGVLV